MKVADITRYEVRNASMVEDKTGSLVYRTDHEVVVDQLIHYIQVLEAKLHTQDMIHTRDTP